MGYFNINYILYNIRKILKYSLFFMLFFSFIVFCLLLMTNDAKASFEPGVYNMIRDDVNSFDYFDLTFTIDSQGQVSVSGPMGNSSNHNQVTANFTWTTFNVFDNNYDYIPILTKHYFNLSYFYYKVPKGSNYYAFNAQSFPSNEYNASFYCDQAYEIYLNNNTSPAASYPAGHIDTMTDYTSYALCTNYTDSTLTTVIYPDTPTFEPPYIDLPNDSTNTFVSGEFSQFMVVSNDSIDELYFHIEANPSVIPITNKLELTLDESSPYYLNNYTPSDGGKVFLISKFLLPDGYVNDTPYNMWLGYVVDDVLYTTDVLAWTTSFSSKAIENDRIALESGLADDISTVNSFIQSDKLDVNDYDLPMVQFDFNQEHFLSDLFTNIRNAFTGDTYTDFVFTFPVSGETITIPSNYIESHIPTVILNLIRLFYWYIIGRFMLKDVFRTVDKMRQGDWFLRSEGNIKTEVL